MENPWVAISDGDLILTKDRPYVDAFNLDAEPKYRFDDSVLPQPFLGRSDAPIVVLALNPGGAGWTAEEPYGEAIRANLVSGGGTSFPALREEFSATSGKWWAACLKKVAAEAEVPLSVLADHLLAVEFFPYHSKRYRAMPVTLPSQWWSFSLVKQAVDRGALVVVLRGVKRWTVAVPGLRDGDAVFAKDPQSAVIRRTNFEDEADYERVLDAVRTAVSGTPKTGDPALLIAKHVSDLTRTYPGVDPAKVATSLADILRDNPDMTASRARDEFLRLATQPVDPVAQPF